MTDALHALAERVQQRSTLHADTLANAARQIARGEAYNIAATEAAMFSSGTTLQQFQQMVETARGRIERFQAFRQLDAAEKARAKLTRQIDKAGAEFERTLAALAEARAKLDSEADELDHRINAALQAREWLTSPEHVIGPLSDQIRAARAAVTATAEAIGPAGRYLTDAQDRRTQAQQWLDYLTKIKNFDVAQLADQERRAELTARLKTSTFEDVEKWGRALRRAQTDHAAAEDAHTAARDAHQRAAAELAALQQQALAEG